MYLILQSRTDQSGWHELKCIHEAAGLQYSDLAVVNFSSDFVMPEMLLEYGRQAKAIIVGGMGESGHDETDPVKKEWFRRLRNKIVPVLGELAEIDGMKMLGICSGHQFLAEALGAKVEHDPNQVEVGIKPVTLSHEGKKDPLFKGMTETFSAVQAHSVSVLAQPRGTTLLAKSERCPIQAFRYKDSIYGVQFHPELDEEGLEERIEIYGRYDDHYMATGVLAVKADQVIRNFINIANTNQSVKPKVKKAVARKA